MIIKITSISWNDSNPAIRKVALDLQNALSPLFKDSYYGGDIKQFAAVSVIFSDDPEDNAKWCKSNDKVGSFKDPLILSRIRYISFAIPFFPAEIELINEPIIVCYFVMH